MPGIDIILQLRPNNPPSARYVAEYVRTIHIYCATSNLKISLAPEIAIFCPPGTAPSINGTKRSWFLYGQGASPISQGHSRCTGGQTIKLYIVLTVSLISSTQVIRDQCWINESLKTCDWVPENEETADESDDTVTTADLDSLLHGSCNTFYCFSKSLTYNKGLSIQSKSPSTSSFLTKHRRPILLR